LNPMWGQLLAQWY